MENNDGEVDYRHRHAFRQDVDHGKFPTFLTLHTLGALNLFSCTGEFTCAFFWG